jgi:DinB superfamily
MGPQPEMNSMSENLSQVLASLAQTPSTLAKLMDGLSESHLRAKDSPDEFSIVENLCHLRDIEIEGYTVRINRILTEVGPTLDDIDGARLALERNYNYQSAQEALTEFQGARLANVDVLRGVDEQQLNREGVLQGVGTVTLQKLLSMMRDHDEDHLSEIRVLRRRLTAV